MFCSKCGNKLVEDGSFCSNCGYKILETKDSKVNYQDVEVVDNSQDIISKTSEDEYYQSNNHVTNNILMGTDGKMRWVYELNMWKNPTLFFTIWKVFLIGAMLPPIVVFFSEIGYGILGAVIAFFKVAGLIVGIMTLLVLIAYSIYTLINGGKYCVIFEMNDFGINHIQMQKQFKKNQLISMVTVVAGILGGNIQATAAGLIAGSKQSLYCKFSKVTKVVIRKKRNVIYVNEGLIHNQVYVDPTDFEFIKDFIVSHSNKAKVVFK